MSTEISGVVHFLERGAAAYVHKYDIYTALVDAVLLAMIGDKFVSRRFVDKMN